MRRSQRGSRRNNAGGNNDWGTEGAFSGLLGSDPSMSTSLYTVMPFAENLWLREPCSCALHAGGEDASKPQPPQRGKLESLSIPQAIRQKVEDAAEALGGRVTVGDVAARAGVTLGDAERTLNALAADAQGVLEVDTSCTITAA